MKGSSIISLLLKDENVNLYTKIFIFLYYKHKNCDYLITDLIIIKYLKLENTKNNRRKILICLKKMEKNKIIKIKIKLRRRFFKWTLENDIDQELERKNIIIPEFNWLEDALK